MAKGMSLADLSESLKNERYDITKATLSNYENGKYLPGEDLKKALAQILNVSMDFIERNNNLLYDLSFFNLPKMVDRKQQNLEAFISVELNRLQYIDNILSIKTNWRVPEKKQYLIEKGDEIEELADRFREEYRAGSSAISSVCAVLEDRGWHIFSLPDYCSYDNLNISGYDKISGIPFILYKPDGYQDEMRLALLKSVGFSLIDGKNEKETNLLIDRFARAVLLSRENAEHFFGKKRTTLTELELSTGKKLFGIGKKYIIKRLDELSIIPNSLKREFELHVNQKHDLVRSSGLMDACTFFDVPTTYEMRVARANAEGLTNLTSTKLIFTGNGF